MEEVPCTVLNMDFFDRLRSAGESKAGHVKTSPTVSHKFEAGHTKTMINMFHASL